MAATPGPGGGAQINNTSTNKSTPSSKTAFKEVSSLITKFSRKDTESGQWRATPKPASKMSTENPTAPEQPQPQPRVTTEDQPQVPPTAGAESNPEGPGAVQGAEGGENTNAAETAVVSYATMVDRTNLDTDYKLTLWFRKNATVPSTTLSIKQKGKLLNRLGIPRGKCRIFNESRRDRIVLTVAGSVPSNSLNLTQSLEIKPGLWSKPIAPIVKEKMVNLFWTTEKTEYQDIVWTLEHFGVITGNVEYQVYRVSPGADEDEKMMDGVMSMDRQVKMKIKRNIPSIILVGNERVNIRYDGQAKSCSRCLMRLHVCPAKGDARLCQNLWERRDEPGDGPHKRAKERGNLITMMRDELAGSSNWGGDGSGMSSSMEGYADHVDICNLPEEVKAEQLLDHLKKKGVTLRIGQLSQDEVNKTKWRVHELLPQEVQCIMMLVHKSEIGTNGRKIECYPVISSTPENAGRQQPFVPSRDNTGVDGEGDPDAGMPRRNLADELNDLGEGKEVSPNLTEHALKGANNDDKIANNLSKGSGTDTSSDTSSVMSVQSDSDDDPVEVDEDNHTVPRPGTGTGGEPVKTGVKPKEPAKAARVVNVKNDKPKPNTPKTAKGMNSLRNLVNETKAEAERAQLEAKAKADKANASKKEDDLKEAEKAEKVAQAARRKAFKVENKWDEAVKNQAALLEITKNSSKRNADNQSPGKTDDEGWVSPKTKKTSNKARQDKKKGRREKTPEEKDLEASLFGK